jgi:hypothetical protein
MGSAFRKRGLFPFSCHILQLIATCLVAENLAADDSVFGTYSGECTLNNEPTRVELEIVRSDRYSRGGADAILSFYRKNETSPANRITVWGGYRDVPQPRRRGDRSPPQTKREFHFSAPDSSEAFGGQFRLNLEQDAGALKGTVFLDKRGEKTEEMPIRLSPKEASSADATTNATPAAEAKVNPNDITGVYEGALTAEKKQFFAQLRLSREGTNDLSGELIFSATAADQRPLGSFKLNGAFDSANNTFKLSSGGELTSSYGLILATADGNFDPGSGKIRAQLTPRGGTLELTRNENKTAEFQAKSTESTKRLVEGPVGLAQARSDDERRDAIVRWFRRLKQEYPDLDLHHSILGPELYGKVLNLFSDDDFVPVFGKPFEALTADDRNYVKQLFRRLFTGERRELLDGFGDFLDRPFILPTGSFSYADVAPQLAFRRTVRKQWHETMDRLKGLSPTSADYDELLSLEKKETEPFRDLWPSEFKQFQEAVESTKRRLADTVATQRLDKVMANASGLEGARLLADWIDQQVDVLKYISDETHKKLKARINEKADELLAEPLRNEADAVTQLGGGILAVRAGKTWYYELLKNYGFARDSSSFQNAVARLQARRGADLDAAAEDIINEVNVQTTAQDLYEVVGTYLGVPGDNKTAGGAKIAQAVTERKKAIPPEEPSNAQLTNGQKIWTTIGAILLGAAVLDAMAGPREPSQSGDIPRTHWKCTRCGGSGLEYAGDQGSPLFGGMRVCTLCGGSGEGW